MQRLAIVDEWLQDPEFAALPLEQKRATLTNYFDTELVDDEFKTKDDNFKAKVRDNFLNAHLGDEIVRQQQERLHPADRGIDWNAQAVPDGDWGYVGDQSKERSELTGAAKHSLAEAGKAVSSDIAGGLSRWGRRAKGYSEELDATQQGQNWGKRTDGTPKGKGFLGILERPDGAVSTELSIGVQIDGKETEIPAIVPTLTSQELEHLLSGGEITEAIIKKSVDYAKQRISQGKSPFAQEGEQKTYQPPGFPASSPPPLTGYESPVIPKLERRDDLWDSLASFSETNKAYYETLKKQDPDISRYMDRVNSGAATFVEKVVGNIGPTVAGIATNVAVPVVGPALTMSMFLNLNEDETLQEVKNALVASGVDEQTATHQAEKIARNVAIPKSMMDFLGVERISSAITKPLKEKLFSTLVGIGLTSLTEGSTEWAQGITDEVAKEWALKPAGETNEAFAARVINKLPEIADRRTEDFYIGAATGGGIHAVAEGVKHTIFQGRPPATSDSDINKALQAGAQAAAQQQQTDQITQVFRSMMNKGIGTGSGQVDIDEIKAFRQVVPQGHPVTQEIDNVLAQLEKDQEPPIELTDVVEQPIGVPGVPEPTGKKAEESAQAFEDATAQEERVRQSPSSREKLRTQVEEESDKSQLYGLEGRVPYLKRDIDQLRGGEKGQRIHLEPGYGDTYDRNVIGVKADIPDWFRDGQKRFKWKREDAADALDRYLVGDDTLTENQMAMVNAALDASEEQRNNDYLNYAAEIEQNPALISGMPLEEYRILLEALDHAKIYRGPVETSASVFRETVEGEAIRAVSEELGISEEEFRSIIENPDIPEVDTGRAWEGMSEEDRNFMEMWDREQVSAEKQKGKEPWEMTFKEWIKAWEKANPISLRQGSDAWDAAEINRLEYGVKSPIGIVSHADVIKKARSEGKPIPPEVLAEYPDLAPPAPTHIQDVEGAAEPKAPPAIDLLSELKNVLKNYEALTPEGRKEIINKGLATVMASGKRAGQLRLNGSGLKELSWLNKGPTMKEAAGDPSPTQTPAKPPKAKFISHLLTRGVADVGGVTYKVLRNSPTDTFYYQKIEGGFRIEKGPGYPARWTQAEAIDKILEDVGESAWEEKGKEPVKPLTTATEPSTIDQTPPSELTPEALLAEWDRQAAELESQSEPEKIEFEVHSLETGKTGTMSVPDIPKRKKPLKAKDLKANHEAKKKAAETKDHLSNVMDAFKQINDILGDEGAIGPGAQIDETKWQKIKPLLQYAWNETVAAGKSATEFVKLAMQGLSPKGRPYFEKFVREEIGGASDESRRPDTGPGELSDVLEGEAGTPAPVRAGEDGGVVPKRPKETVPGDETGGAEGGSLRGSTGEESQSGEGSDRGDRPGRDLPDRQGTEGTSGRKDGDADQGVGEEPARRPSGPATKGAIPQAIPEADRNHTIKDEDIIVPSGAEAKIKANITAIRLLKNLNSPENRNPTTEEKQVLARYTGWGQFSQKVFNADFSRLADKYGDIPPSSEFPYYGRTEAIEKYQDWAKRYGKALHPALGGAMTKEEWTSAEASVINAHYTTRPIIKAMWSLADRLGFAGGTVLEPAGGVGHFFGLMPQDLANRSVMYGVEKDTLSAQIFQKLYPQAKVENTPFERSKIILDNSMDIVITNVPFANVAIKDKNHPDYSGWSLHNYYFGRMLTAAKPGGLVIAITSSWTMDAKSNAKMRDYLAGRADLVGAIRLPNTAFKENAGTDVVTDIIVLRKKGPVPVDFGKEFTTTQRLDTPENKKLLEEFDKKKAALDEAEKQKPPKDETDRARKIRLGSKKVLKDDLAKVMDEIQKAYRVNEYFISNPDMVLGAHSMKGTMYADNSYTVDPTGQLEVQVQKAIEAFPENIVNAAETSNKPVAEKWAGMSDKEGTLTRKDGKVYLVENGRLVTPTYMNSKGEEFEVTDPAKIARLNAYLDVRDTTSKLFDLMDDPNATDAEIKAQQLRLNKVYDAYVKKFKAFGESANSWLADADNDFGTVDALEVAAKVKVGGKTETVYYKADIFTKRTKFPFVEPTSAANIEDAVNLSIVYRGGIDPDYVGSLTGQTNKEAILQAVIDEGLGFINPETGMLEQRDLYLSRNVKKKLRQAEAAVKAGNDVYQKNIEALKPVIPEDVDIEFVSFKIGSTWIPPECIQDFMKEVLDVDAKVEYSTTDRAGRWRITDLNNEENTKNRETYGTEDMSATSLIAKALNFKPVVIKRTEKDEYGKSHTYEDKEASKEAALKTQELNEHFVRWAKTHDKWAPELTKTYNDEKNGVILRKHQEPKIEHYPNASTVITLRPHQKIAVSRALQESALLAYGVGTGKTFIFITAAMEMKRIGTAQKPVIVAHNQTIDQYRKSFQVLYPGAKVLIPNYRQRSARMRKKTLVSIATGDWDCVVLPQSFFDGIANDPDREAAFVEDRIAEMDEAIAEATAEEGEKSLTVKDMVKAKEKRRQKLADLLARRKDEVLTFEKMGIDAMLIDEAHAYKRSEFFTKLNKVKGIDSGSSQRSTSLILKSEIVRRKTGGKNVITATGTPISNTMAELWTMLRYVRPDLLEEYGVELFDSFAGTFGNTVEGLEETPSGFKEVMRFAEYVNGPELLTMFFSGADVRLTKDADLKLPKMRGGKPEAIICEQSPELRRYLNNILAEWTAWEKLPGKQKRKLRHVPLVLYGKAKKAAIDLRLIDPAHYKFDPDGKIGKALDNIHRIWKETNDQKGTQIVFLDVFQDDANHPTFNAHKDIRQRLSMMGIPANEIVLFGELTEKQMDDAKARIRAGESRVVIGTTQKLGIGVDIADKMVAAHHISVPDRPMDIEQRNGRIIRQTNENETVDILNYCTKDSLDSVLFHRLYKKQRFSDQVLSGDIEGRTFADPYSEEQVTFAEFAAAASGEAGKLLFEKNDLTAQEHKYKIAETAYIRQISNAKGKVRDLPGQIEEGKVKLKAAQTMEERLRKMFPDLKLDTVTYDGKTMERKDFIDLVEKKIEEITKHWETHYVGMAMGDFDQEKATRFKSTIVPLLSASAGDIKLDLTLEVVTNYDRQQAIKKPSTKIELTKIGDVDISYFLDGKNIGKDWTEAAKVKSNFTRKFNDRISTLIAQAEHQQKNIETLENDLKEFENIAKTPFRYTDELAALRKRIAEINQELIQISKKVDGEQGEDVEVAEETMRSVAQPVDKGPTLEVKAYDGSLRKVSVKEIGDYAYHRDVDNNKKSYTVTHIPSKLKVVGDLPKEADAKRLATMMSQMKKRWNGEGATPDVFIKEGMAVRDQFYRENKNIQMSMRDAPFLIARTREAHPESLEKLRSDVYGWLKDVLPDTAVKRLAVELTPRITRSGKNLDESARQWSELRETPGEVAGTAKVDPLAAFIEISYNFADPDIQQSTYHEGFHVAMRWLLPEKDVQAILKHFNGNEEAAADAFMTFCADQKGRTGEGTPGAVKMIFYKLRRLLQMVRNALTGKGFSRPEDVFGRLLTHQYDLLPTSAREARVKGLRGDRMQLAGEKAIGAPTGQLARAQKMLAEGKSEQEVWDATGWTKEASGKWAFRIDDSGAKWKPGIVATVKNIIGKPYDLKDALHHPDLFKAYPQLKNMKLVFGDIGLGNAAYDPETKTIYINNILRGNPEGTTPSKATLKTVLHEVQHSIQGIEGFATGAAPWSYPVHWSETAIPELQKQIEELQKRFVNAKGHERVTLEKEINDKIRTMGDWAEESKGQTQDEQYKRTAGELYSREASAQFKGLPGTMDGIPREQWIVKDGDGTSFSVEVGSDLWWDIHEELEDKYETLINNTMDEFRSSGVNDTQKWSVVPTSDITTIWNDFISDGVVRDKRGLKKIVDKIVNNAVQLRINTELMAHTQAKPNEVLTDFEIDPLTDEENDRLTDWMEDPNTGQWRISDRIGEIMSLTSNILAAPTKEKQLVAIDKLLNWAHQRADMASLFVEGGRMTLDELAGELPDSGKQDVTYLSLSERFNPQEEDIRYSLRDPSQTPEEWAKEFLKGYIEAQPEAKKAEVKQAIEKEEKAYPKQERTNSLGGWESFKRFLERDKAGWAEQKDDFKVWQRILSQPAHYFHEIPAMGRVYDAGTKSSDNRQRLTDQIIKAPDGHYYTKDLGDLRKKDKTAYDKLQEYLKDHDQNKIGYSIAKNNETRQWDLFGVKDKKVPIGSFDNETDAIDAMIESEADDYRKDGASENAMTALIAARRISNNGFNILFQGMRDLEDYYKKTGQEMPKEVITVDGKEVEVDLKLALAQMGDMRGYYMPRIRRPGRYVGLATKKGEHPVRQHFDTKVTLKAWQVKMEGKGFAVTKDTTNRMPEDVFELAGHVVAQEAIIQEALNRIRVKKYTLADFGLEVIDRKGGPGRRDFMVKGPTSKDTNALFKRMGGRYYESDKGGPRVWHFDNPGANFDNRLAKAIAMEQAAVDIDTQTRAVFAKALTEQVANVIKGRGSRMHMIKRSEQTGLDVWEGYEEDPTIAMTKYARGVAAGEAKKRMAHDMLLAFTGTDVSWAEFRGQHADAEYEDYLEFVENRRVDPVKQTRAFQEGKSYIEHMLRNEEAVDRLIGTVKGIAVLKYLGGRVSAPIVNLTALVTSVPAAMNGFADIPMHKTLGYVARASKLYGQYKFGDKAGLPDDVRSLFDEIEANAWHNAQYNREALAVLRGKMGRTWDNIVDWAMIGFGVTEQLNRVATIAGTYLGMKEGGGTNHEAMLKTAKRVADQAHGTYGKVNYPLLARGGHVAAQVLKSFYVFKTFSHNYLLTMKDLWGPGWTPEHGKAFLYMAASPAILAGSGAFVGLPIAKLIAGMFMDDDPEEGFYDWLMRTFGGWAETLGRYGLAGMAGINLKGSLKIGISDLPTDLKSLGGAPLSVVDDLWEGGKLIGNGDTMKGVERIAPLALAAPVKAYREATEGLTTKTNAPIWWGKKRAKADPVDAVLRAMSFNPAKISRIREKKWAETQQEERYRKQRSEIQARINKFILTPAAKRDKEAGAELLEEANEYNRQVQDAGLVGVIPVITTKSIMQNLLRNFRPARKEQVRRLREEKAVGGK